MAQLSFEDLVNGVVPDASDFNSRLNALKNRINNGMESDNIADNAVTTGKINNDAVTLAKIANGTLGGLIYFAAAGATTELAGNTTTSRKVLAQTGDGTNSSAPAWTDISASQEDQETGTETTKFVTPAIQQFHPSAAKAWFSLNGTGTPAMNASYNMDSSITDNGTGDYTVTMTTDFSSAAFCAVGMAEAESNSEQGTNVAISTKTAQAAGTLRVIVTNDGNSPRDVAKVNVAMFGDQA